MNETNLVEFHSKHCKNKEHTMCCGLWVGLGFEVLCYCHCHRKNKMVLDGVDGTPTSNTFQNSKSPSQEAIQTR
jgi:hypothetical protein